MCYDCADKYGSNVLECNSEEVTICGIIARHRVLAQTIFYKKKVDIGGGIWKFKSCTTCISINNYAVKNIGTDGTGDIILL